MNIEIKPICQKCLNALDISDTTTGDASGHPAIKYYVEPCEACLETAREEAVADYISDQLAMSIDKSMDDRHDR